MNWENKFVFYGEKFPFKKGSPKKSYNKESVDNNSLSSISYVKKKKARKIEFWSCKVLEI